MLRMGVGEGLVERYKILCLDDEKVVLTALKRELERNPEYQVFTADNAEDALRLAKDTLFDVYLVDQYMPIMDGVTFACKLREYDLDPLIFYLTGQDYDGKAYRACLRDGETSGAYYFTKPWNESLHVGLAQALKNKREKNLLRVENQKLNHWVAKFFEEASIAQSITEKPDQDALLDHLYQRLREREAVDGVDVYLLAGRRLELVRSDKLLGAAPDKLNKETVSKALKEGPIIQKSEKGWNYFSALGMKKQKIGLVHLNLQRMEDENLQFIDYIIHQGGLMIEQVLIQLKLAKTLKDLEKTQKELLETEKNSFITGLARWLMHNINNIICGLKGDSDLIKMAWHAYSEQPVKSKEWHALSQQLNDSLPAMENAIQRLIHLVDNFRFIANISKGKVKRSEFNRLIKIAVQNFSNLRQGDSDRVQIKEKYDPHLEYVNVNREMILRMVEEVLAKALTALAGASGIIEVQTKKNKGFAEIIITDSGISKEPNGRQWLQESLFSSNIPLEVGGMELVIIKEAVNFHQGEIFFNNLKGKGSQVRIRLPLNNRKDTSSLGAKSK